MNDEEIFLDENKWDDMFQVSIMCAGVFGRSPTGWIKEKQNK